MFEGIMRVLGVDFSLNGTGLSLFDGKDVIFKKAFTSIKKNYDQDNEVFILSPKFNSTGEKLDWVANQIIQCTDYDFVCMEDHIGSYYEWMDGYGIIKHLLRSNKKPYIMVSPTTVKKYAGDGKADKNMMSFFLRKDYNMDFDNIGKLANNIVDATWMAIIGYKYYKIYIEKDKKCIDTPARLKILKTLYNKQGDPIDYHNTNAN